MKLGLLTSMLDTHDYYGGRRFTYEEVVDFAAEHGFASIECCCWLRPTNFCGRIDPGVIHIDAERALEDDAYAEHIVEYRNRRTSLFRRWRIIRTR